MADKRIEPAFPDAAATNELAAARVEKKTSLKRKRSLRRKRSLKRRGA